MLGTLRIDIQIYINKYLKIAPIIFPIAGLISGSKIGQLFIIARSRQRFKAELLELAIKRLVEKHLEQRSTNGKETLFRFEASKPKEDYFCYI